jgi:DNA-binding transcriptional LysR family regulator
MLDLKRLHAFAVLAEELHFGRAAVRLNITQPPLTIAIQSLESELGVTLFERTKRSVRLSQAGSALLPEAKSLLASEARIREAVRARVAGETGRIVLAFVSIVDYSFLPSLLRQFRSIAPSVAVELREATTDVQLQWLGSGEIDAGILLGPLGDQGLSRRATNELDYRTLASERLVLALPSEHPHARAKTPISLAKFAEQAFVSIPRHIAPRLHDAISGACLEAGFAPRVVQEAIQMQTVISLVSAGMGVAIVPHAVTNLRRDGVVYRALQRSTSKFEIGISFRRDATSAALKRFVALATKAKH